MEARVKARDRRFCRVNPANERAARSGHLSGPERSKQMRQANISRLERYVKLSRNELSRGTLWQS